MRKVHFHDVLPRGLRGAEAAVRDRGRKTALLERVPKEPPLSEVKHRTHGGLHVPLVVVSHPSHDSIQSIEPSNRRETHPNVC